MALVNINETLSKHPNGQMKTFRYRTRTVKVPGREPKPYNLVFRHHNKYTVGPKANFFGVHASYAQAVNSTDYYNALYVDSLGSLNYRGGFGPARHAVYNKAYSKLVDKLGDRSEMLTFLAERESTRKMVGSRSKQLLFALVALKRGKFKEFLRILRVAPLAKHKRMVKNKVRDAGGLWLEYWFGWAPSVADIYTAVDGWQRPIPDMPIWASSGWAWKKTRTGGNSYYNASETTEGHLKIKIGARVRMVNPDLWEANRLGFTNPALTAFQILPWSWLLNWFVNLESTIGSLSDFVGLDVSEVYVTRFVKEKLHYEYTGRNMYKDNWHRMDRETVLMKREIFPKIPPPTLTLTIPGLSWTRQATVVSLLVQQLSEVVFVQKPRGRTRLIKPPKYRG